ncbi:NUDIX domain-containing protein [Kitasatospora aureofaciens]|uniref:NUDIX domain-containing protein n=1 Tax=Kitasatospora aureofaciens TaxID=1894 RepID=UPI001C47C12B|nr:NUDIX domain-containing protein [Kitasatospora aureofaciens]MBV6699641.1 NUDIX domain-containing protein [Kitasatospora aureofaciens]
MLNSLRAVPSRHQSLVLNDAGQVLLVETSNRTTLTLPGGAAGKGEPPHLAARRHLESATGLVRALRCLLVADYTAARRPFTFIHWGGRLTLDDAAAVQHRRAVHWVDESVFPDVLAPDDHRRLAHALAFYTFGSILPVLVDGAPPE